MRHRIPIGPLALLVLSSGMIGWGLTQEPKSLPNRVLPGIQQDGFVQLPNQWKLKPAGKSIDVGNLPVNIQFHPSGQFAAVLHCGMKEHEVVILDTNPKKRHIVSRVTVDQAFYGLSFSPDGKQLYCSGGEFDVVHVWDFDRGLPHNHRTISIAGTRKRTVTSGIAFDQSGRDLFVAGLWANTLTRVPLDNPDNKIVIPLKSTKPAAKAAPQGEPPSPPDGRKENALPAPPKLAEEDSTRPIADNGFPYTVLVEPGGKRAFVSLWSKASIAVVDLQSNTLIETWPTELHPTEMVIDPNGRAMFVACSNSTKVTVIDLKTGDTMQTIHAALYPKAPSGNTPNSLTLTPDGEMLFVANADANNLAVFNVADPKTAKPLGFIPTGWYPTSVRYNPLDKTLYVANGKGALSRSNPSGPSPSAPQLRDLAEYIGALFQGSVSMIPLPTPAQMAAYSRTAFECSPLLQDAAPRSMKVAADNPIPKKIGEKSPIKYVIYCVKENRTYDQVLGDLPQGNGDPNICLFPAAITPNHHKIVSEFVLLDNFYVDGEVSADGHEWSMGAYATDFVEKMWPLSYRGSPKGTFGYPSEGQMNEVARPAGGYLWDRAKEAGVSYRSYGEWVTNGKKNADGTFEDATANVKELVGHIDPRYRGYDLDYPDVNRAERFISELKRFEQAGDMPRLQIIRLPNDHTFGTRVGKPTPTAMVADNDLALGRVVEAVTRSKFWKETAIFVVEDDAQNGPDHVDAHRSVAMVISPCTKRKYVDRTMYSTASMLRTMELILGLKPMSQFDAAAMPMYHSFQAKPDLTPYTHVVPKVDRNAKNEPTAWGRELSEKFNLAKEDAADDILFNEVIWRSVKGAHSKMPAPVRAAFFVPVKAKDGDDDDDDDKDDDD